jgi:hypothetical protein
MIHKPPNPNNIDTTLVNLLFGKDIDPLASLCNLSWYDRVHYAWYDRVHYGRCC